MYLRFQFAINLTYLRKNKRDTFPQRGRIETEISPSKQR